MYKYNDSASTIKDDFIIQSVSKCPLFIEWTVYTYALNQLYVHVHLIMVEIYETGCIIYLQIVKGAKKIVHLQGNSEKCTGAFMFGCREIFYLSKSCRKSGLISHLSIEFTQKIFILCLDFITNINICKFILKNIFD